MKGKKLQGKRYIELTRCSSAGQADTSIDAQHALVEQFARENGMIRAGVVELAGVSGSIPGIRTDIDQIIRRKREQDDFEVVLLQDSTRFTRAGTVHGMKLLFDLRTAGLEVVFVQDDLPDGELGDVLRSMKFYAGNEQVRSLAFNVTRGLSFSLTEGRSAHCKAPPYGLDRLYTAEDGTPKHIIRNLPDGSQVKLVADGSGTVLERFGRNEKTGVPAHYIKQKNERIVLVPGDPAHLQVVREMFDRHHRDGWGYGRIAQDLNDRGVMGPRGGLWYSFTVRNILLNPVFLGTGLANVVTKSIYYSRGQNGPVQKDAGLRKVAEGRPGPELRPVEDWFEREEPALKNLLDEAVRPAAEAKQKKRLDALATGQTQHGQRSRHTDSDFILTGILTAKQSGLPMSGRRTGKPGMKWRSYQITRAISAPSVKVPKTMIGAEPLEQAVVGALQLILLEADHLRPQIEKMAREELRRDRDGKKDSTKLQAEKDLLAKRIRFAIANLDDVGKEAVKGDLQAWQVRIRAIDAEMRRAIEVSQAPDNPAAIAESVCAKLRALGEILPTLPPAALRDVLKTFVSKLEVDLETKAVVAEFALPEWSSLDLGKVSLTEGLVYKTDGQAHPALTISRGLFWHRKEYFLYDFAA